MTNIMRRTCMAFMMRGYNNSGRGSSSIIASPLLGRVASSYIINSGDFCGIHHSSVLRLASSDSFTSSSSSFTPPEPPTSKGTSIFPNIDFSVEDNQDSLSFKRNNDEDAVFVVTGANRGIGLQFVKSLIERTKGNIVACCRSPDMAHDLQEYISSLDESSLSGRIQIVTLDVENQQSIEDAALQIKELYNNRVDLLLNVAGILGDGTNTPGPERAMSKLDRDWVEKTLAVNVIGPVMLSKELAPAMKSKLIKSKGKRSDGTTPSNKERPISIIANLSARVGSITDNELGGWYSYRFSKAALNQATRTMAHELKRQGTWSIALHPGTTDTDLSKPFQRNVQEGRLFPVDFTVTQLLDVIDSMEERNSGGLYDWAGKALPF